MNSEAEITRLAKENETFQKIIETQQHTINLLIDHFISGQKEKKSQKRIKLSLLFWHKKELLTGIGPVTSALPMRRSTD